MCFAAGTRVTLCVVQLDYMCHTFDYLSLITFRMEV